MKEKNTGMLSRIAFSIDFKDYDTDELCEITKLMAAKKQMKITDGAANKLRSFMKPHAGTKFRKRPFCTQNA
ncbi:MAG: hypothetical protein K5886_05910 [Lachnospiraceae bacterium]|nr:hypothetical protein [Lachnospiraceae bacterium]